MGLLDFLKPQPARVGGTIGYLGLGEWWLSAFTDAERRHILEVYQPLGSTGASLESGSISYTSQTPVGLLWALAGGSPSLKIVLSRIGSLRKPRNSRRPRLSSTGISCTRRKSPCSTKTATIRP